MKMRKIMALGMAALMTMSMVAVYNILKGLGLAQTLTALIVCAAAGAAMGYYILVALPIVILFIWLQKYYVEGLSGAVKG